MNNFIMQRYCEEVQLTLAGCGTNRYLCLGNQEWYIREDNNWIHVNYIDTLELEEAYQCLKQS